MARLFNGLMGLFAEEKKRKRMVHEKPKVIPGWRPSAVTCLHTFHQLIRVIRQIPGLPFPWIYVCGKLEVLIPASSTRAGSRG